MVYCSALAPTSKPIESSPEEQPQPSPRRNETDDLDNEPIPERPRLSLPISEDTTTTTDDSPVPPPRLSLPFDEEDITQRSVEYPRRALSEKDRARLERMSFGDVRMSENFGDLSRFDGASETGDATMLQQMNEEQMQEDATLSQEGFDAGWVLYVCTCTSLTSMSAARQRILVDSASTLNSRHHIPLLARNSMSRRLSRMSQTFSSTNPSLPMSSKGFPRRTTTQAPNSAGLRSTWQTNPPNRSPRRPSILAVACATNLLRAVAKKRSSPVMAFPFRTCRPPWSRSWPCGTRGQEPAARRRSARRRSLRLSRRRSGSLSRPARISRYTPNMRVGRPLMRAT